MSEFFTELISTPVALFLLIVVIVHMTIIWFRSYLDYKQSKTNLIELAQQLRESEARVQSLLKKMDDNRNAIISDLQKVNDDLNRQIEERRHLNDF
jgi:hypothetical protein